MGEAQEGSKSSGTTATESCSYQKNIHEQIDCSTVDDCLTAPVHMQVDASASPSSGLDSQLLATSSPAKPQSAGAGVAGSFNQVSRPAAKAALEEDRRMRRQSSNRQAGVKNRTKRAEAAQGLDEHVAAATARLKDLQEQLAACRKWHAELIQQNAALLTRLDVLEPGASKAFAIQASTGAVADAPPSSGVSDSASEQHFNGNSQREGLSWTQAGSPAPSSHDYPPRQQLNLGVRQGPVSIGSARDQTLAGDMTPMPAHALSHCSALFGLPQGTGDGAQVQVKTGLTASQGLALTHARRAGSSLSLEPYHTARSYATQPGSTQGAFPQSHLQPLPPQPQPQQQQGVHAGEYASSPALPDAGAPAAACTSSAHASAPVGRRAMHLQGLQSSAQVPIFGAAVAFSAVGTGTAGW